MISFLDHIDRTFFLFLNGFHNPFFDRIMYDGTKSLIWLPLYLFFLFLVIRKYKWNTFLIIVLTALMILVSDQLSNVVKDSVQRLRPSHQPGMLIHIVDAYKGGMFGFYSAHASNTFSVAIFVILLLGRKWYVILPVLLWSVFMSYTRIYLGVHYPGDILCGWIAGGIIGFLFWKGAAVSINLIRKKS
ncbi:MAG: phosphatase PAP2 family protein [Bacteroidetes bacterium]|nr:phosphatase PAP2 family protein [Bacteroidota bacterium]